MKGEAGAAKTGVSGAGHLQYTERPEPRRGPAPPRIGEALCLFEDERVMVHAAGGEKISHRGLGIAALELGLEDALVLDGELDVARHDMVDVGGEQRERGERP